MSSTLLINHASPLIQITYAAASITNSYTLAGGFSSPVVMMMVVSTLDQPVQVSFDGTNNHLAVPAGSTVPVFIPLNFKENRIVFSHVNVFVKQIGAPASGSLYICAFTNT